MLALLWRSRARSLPTHHPAWRTMNTPTQPSVCLPSDAPILLPPGVISCDYCRRQLEDGDAFYQLTVGMDEAPRFVGDSPAEGPLVEATSESTVCSRCEPQVSEALDVLLTALWKLRQPDGTEGDPEAFSPDAPHDREPDTERRPCPATTDKT